MLVAKGRGLANGAGSAGPSSKLLGCQGRYKQPATVQHLIAPARRPLDCSSHTIEDLRSSVADLFVDSTRRTPSAGAPAECVVCGLQQADAAAAPAPTGTQAPGRQVLRVREGHEGGVARWQVLGERAGQHDGALLVCTWRTVAAYQACLAATTGLPLVQPSSTLLRAREGISPCEGWV